MSEFIWVDESNNILGTVTREKAHKEGVLHRISVVYVLKENKILIQERTDTGTLDHSAAGHVDVGESHFEAAKRELREELGIENVELKEIGDAESDEIFSQAGKHIRHKQKIFVCYADPGKIDPAEVKSVFWDDPHEVFKAMKKEPEKYAGGFKSSIKVLLESNSNVPR